jgi:hypothetical protein
MTTPYDPTENAIDAAIQREIDRYPSTRQTTCDSCGWTFSQTPWRGKMQPETCPECDMAPKRAEVERVLVSNSDLKKPTPHPFEAWCETLEGKKCMSGQAYGVYLKARLLAAFCAGRASAG